MAVVYVVILLGTMLMRLGVTTVYLVHGEYYSNGISQPRV